VLTVFNPDAALPQQSVSTMCVPRGPGRCPVLHVAAMGPNGNRAEQS
jgi:hypothetical protein